MKKIGVILLVIFLSMIPVSTTKANPGSFEEEVLKVLKEKQIITEEKYQELSKKLAAGNKSVNEEILDLLQDKKIITEAKHQELKAKAIQEKNSPKRDSAPILVDIT